MAEISNDDAVRHILVFVLGLLIIYIIAGIAAPSFGHNEHPPLATVTRENESVILVTWMGGTDSTFVGNFTITIDNETKYYPHPYLYAAIARYYHPNVTCVNVDAYDLAIQQYRPVGYNCT